MKSQGKHFLSERKLPALSAPSGGGKQQGGIGRSAWGCQHSHFVIEKRVLFKQVSPVYLFILLKIALWVWGPRGERRGVGRFKQAQLPEVREKNEGRLENIQP